MTAPARELVGPDQPSRLAALARPGGITGRLPLPWTLTPRRRRLLFLGLAAPGFLSIFTTPLHRNLVVLVLGVLLFAVALLFRRRTEPVFARAEAAALWPPSPPSQET